MYLLIFPLIIIIVRLDFLPTPSLLSVFLAFSPTNGSMKYWGWRPAPPVCQVRALLLSHVLCHWLGIVGRSYSNEPHPHLLRGGGILSRCFRCALATPPTPAWKILGRHLLMNCIPSHLFTFSFRGRVSLNFQSWSRACDPPASASKVFVITDLN